ncbi:COG1361 S-layer family protein [Methanoregula sp.]|jgi:hypothetical protein|uniref:COG1361 S-layer family protein n=1 Tax=Methanoregula sp. TaxID=2052170 RepID=UPI003C276E76
MKVSRIVIFTCILLSLCAILGTASAYETPESIVAASKVYISSITFDPGAFFTGDTGTVNVAVTNSNNNISSVVNHASFGDQNIKMTSKQYDSTTNIGPLQTQPFVFSVTADALEGTYYPTFSMNFRDADSFYYRATVEIDNRPLELTVVDQPDAFTHGKKKTIYLKVSNPRKNDVRNVVLEVSGDGITAIPSRTFIGDLDQGESIPVNVSMTPDKETTLDLTLNYDNGNNPHTVTLNIPIAFGTDKMLANPVMSNVLVKNDGTVIHVTGDVNNAGLENANTVTVSALSPAVPQDPYKTYVVGALKPDDFGSFEVTFTADPAVTSVPIQLSYKDDDGNIYNASQDVNIASAGLTQQKNSDPPTVPVIAGIVILVVFIGGWFVYLRKKKQ